jgi:hypothetical protein
MINPQIGQIGITSTYTVNPGLIGRGSFPYKTPYQLKYAGMPLEFASSKAYDASADDYLVAIPCGDGHAPKGWAWMTTARTDQLPGAAVAFRPLDADLNVSGYATDEEKFAKITVYPMNAGDLVGMPVAASTSIAINAELSSGTLGFINTATSGDTVFGIAELAADNSTGLAGAICVKVRIVDQYTK